MSTVPLFPYGFRVVGDLHGQRRLVDSAAAFQGHCLATPKAEPGRESYLSAFTFGDEFATYLRAHGTVKGYAGPTCASWLTFDIDPEGRLDEARRDACNLAAFLDDRYPEVEPLVFFSGQKGFAIMLPLAHRPAGGPAFHRVARRLAEFLATLRGVVIDTAIYDRVRPFRAPNSRHPRTGLHKVRVTLDCLMHRDAEAIREWAREPHPFEAPEVPPACPQLAADWMGAEHAVATADRAQPVLGRTPGGRLAYATMDLVRNGCDEGERHTRLFRAAGNMAEVGGNPALIHAILDEIGTDLGLTLADARRQVDCGIERAGSAATPATAEGGAS